MKTIRFENVVVKVSLAKFDINHRKFGHHIGRKGNPQVTRSKIPPTWARKDRRDEMTGVKVNNETSFKDVLLGRNGTKDRKVVKVDNNVSSYMKH